MRAMIGLAMGALLVIVGIRLYVAPNQLNARARYKLRSVVGVVDKVKELNFKSVDQMTPLLAQEGCTELIAINGEPKSGTTWTTRVVHEILYRYCEFSKEPCTIKRWHLKQGVEEMMLELPGERKICVSQTNKHILPHSGSPLGHPNHAMEALDFLQQCVDNGQTVFEKACIPSEWSYEALSDIETKFVLIVRDPRDVVLSASRYYGFQGKWVERIGVASAWISFRHAWMTNAVGSQSPVFPAYYEDMKSDLLGVVRRMALFMGVQLNPRAAKMVVRSCSLEASNEVTIDSRGVAGKFRMAFGNETLRESSAMMQLYLSPELRERYNANT
ncbi:hypothetical protein BSKO_09548 [Bryopsis sp. KO-2023]|nr:hypothetical protein BSKO_09548 [Bryopsis sp. KO-2023]